MEFAQSVPRPAKLVIHQIIAIHVYRIIIISMDNALNNVDKKCYLKKSTLNKNVFVNQVIQ